MKGCLLFDTQIVRGSRANTPNERKRKWRRRQRFGAQGSAVNTGARSPSGATDRRRCLINPSPVCSPSFLFPSSVAVPPVASHRWRRAGRHHTVCCDTLPASLSLRGPRACLLL